MDKSTKKSQIEVTLGTSKIKNFNDLKKFVSMKSLLGEYTDINYNGGIYHRLRGSENGSGSGSSGHLRELRNNEKVTLSNALKEFAKDCVEFANGIDLNQEEHADDKV